MSGVILSINKETMSLGMPWEKEYGYAQAVKVGDTMMYQVRLHMMIMAKLLAKEKWRLKCVKHITIYTRCSHNMEQLYTITDMDSAFAATIKCRNEVFFGALVVSSTIVQIQRLAFPEFMIEIKCVVKI